MSTENQSGTENQPVPEKKKLTDQQLRIAQIAAGLLCAAALVVSIYFSGKFAEENSLLNYMFLVVFLVIMIGRRQIEKRYRLRLGLFSLAMIDGIVVGIIIYSISAFFSPEQLAAEQQSIANNEPNWLAQLGETGKILIIVAVVVLLLVLGVALPLWRHMKRKAAGKEYPMRLPEPEAKPETEEGETAPPDPNGPLTIEQQIAAMTKELEEKENGKEQDK